MKLQVKYTAQLRTALERSEETAELPEGSSLADLLQHLAEQNPAGRPHLLSGAGRVNASLLVVLNDAAVSAADAVSRQLSDGDVVLLLPPIAGG